MQAPPSQGQRGAAANTLGTQTPAVVSPLLPPAERDPSQKKVPQPPARYLQGRPLASHETCSWGPGSRGAALGPAPDLLYRSLPRWDGGEGTNLCCGEGMPRRVSYGTCLGTMPGSNENCEGAARARQSPSSFPPPSGSLPRAHRSPLQTTPPPTVKVKPGTRNAGKAEHGPGDVSPTPHASQNPTQGQLAVANLEGNSGGPQNPLSLYSPPSTSCRGGLQPAVSTSFRSKSRSTCLAAKAGPACWQGGFPCPGACLHPGRTAAACHAHAGPWPLGHGLPLLPQAASTHFLVP